MILYPKEPIAGKSFRVPHPLNFPRYFYFLYLISLFPSTMILQDHQYILPNISGLYRSSPLLDRFIMDTMLETYISHICHWLPCLTLSDLELVLPYPTTPDIITTTCREPVNFRRSLRTGLERQSFGTLILLLSRAVLNRERRS